MRLHRIRQYMGSKKGEVLQVQQQADNEVRTKGVHKPLGSALLHGLLRPAGELCKAPESDESQRQGVGSLTRGIGGVDPDEAKRNGIKRGHDL